MKTEWVSVDEDTPQIQKGFKYCSVDVIGLTAKGEEKKVFFNYRNQIWYNTNGTKCKHRIIKWRSI